MSGADISTFCHDYPYDHNMFSGCEILLPDQMRLVEREAVLGGYVGSNFELMQKAGQSVADYIKAHYSDYLSVFFIGPGNNGGDGIVAYHALKQAGKPVMAILSTSVDDYNGDANKSFGLGDDTDFVCVDKFGDNDVLSAIDQQCGNRPILLVDAVFGIGYKSECRSKKSDRSKNPMRLIRVLRQCREQCRQEIGADRCCVLAIDLPSGIEAASGQVSQNLCVRADVTLTFFRKKLGHSLQPSRQFCGDVIVVDDLGIPSHLLKKSGFCALENDPQYWIQYYPQPVDNAHKYDYGQVSLFGGKDMCGAANLAAQASMRVGAGLSSILAYKGRGDLYRSIVPPHIMVQDFYCDIAKPNHVRAIGFGLGECDQDVDKLVDNLIARHVDDAQKNKGAYVFDAQIFQKGWVDQLGLTKAYAANYILTPHWGEFLRIGQSFGCDYAAMNRWEAVQDFCRKSPAILVLKGSDTIIAQKGRIPIINTHTSPVLASAGTGDVLAGMVAGLAARFMKVIPLETMLDEQEFANKPGNKQDNKQKMLFMASAMAVWMHGEAAKRLGLGLVASDLLREIPHVLTALINGAFTEKLPQNEKK